MSELVLAIDAGTTGVRSMLFAPDGTVKARAYEEFESIFPRPSWVEQNADDWWNATCATIDLCLQSSSTPCSRIAAVSVTNQRETVVPIGENGRPLYNAIVWQDRRTVPQCEWIKEQIPDNDVYTITGLTVDPYFTAPKLLWLKEHEPVIYEDAHAFLLVHDYLVFCLTGTMTTDFSNASRTLLFDIEQAKWSKRMLDALELPGEKLPTPVQSGTILGEVSSEASKVCGLETGTPVVAGGGDQQCAALGVGVVHPGSLKSTTGTGTFILAFSREKKLDASRRVLCSRHVVPNSFVIEASMFTTGSALRWFRDQLGSPEREIAEERGIDPYEVITECAADVPPGSEGIVHIPHFAGAGAPYWNPYARGIFAGLALGHTRHHLIRAILEGVSYEIKTNLDVMNDLGVAAREMRVTGGAARSETWMQIQADVVNKPVIRTEIEEATALGAAMLAYLGIGIYDSLVETADCMVRPLTPLNPRDETRSIYDAGYTRYRTLYEAIKSIHW
ncbi:MAG: xylulokinase [Candidatus Thorarchaeota archaeon]|nr:xylulokinase [Candidatus Thorarchaeota archaeon]